MPLQNHVGELIGTFPRLAPTHAPQLINRAWTRVRDIRLWSWQFVVDAQLFAPGVINAGAASVTQFQSTITLNSTAAAAVIAAGTVPPIASTLLGVGRQIRLGGSSSGALAANGTIYNITAWDGVNTITIDRPFAEASLTNAPYQIFRRIYSAPANPGSSMPTSDSGFIRFISMTNRTGGYTITGRRLHLTQEGLDRVDPTRGATDGSAYGIAPYQPNAAGQPTCELYPAPLTAAIYAVSYYTRWPTLSATVDFPAVPYGLSTCVMDLARYFACQWCLGQVGTFPELQQTNWVALMGSYKGEFLEGLKQCLKQDDEIMTQVPMFVGLRRSMDIPMGGAFLQSHDVSGLLM